MTAERTLDRALRAAALPLLVLLGGAVLACDSRPPEPGAEADADRRAAAQESPDLPGDVEFVPYDVAPELTNMDRVRARLREVYPPSLKERGIGGSVILWLNVDRQGRVQQSHVQEPSDHEALNRAAKLVADSMEFSPALQRDDPVAVWVQQRIRFVADTVGS